MDAVGGWSGALYTRTRDPFEITTGTVEDFRRRQAAAPTEDCEEQTR